MPLRNHIAVVVLTASLAGCVETTTHSAGMQQQKKPAHTPQTKVTTSSGKNNSTSDAVWKLPPAASPAAAVPKQTTGDPGDVYRVLCFYPINMWKSFDAEGDPNPEGFTFVMYLLSHKTNKGIYANGTFHVRIFLVEPEADGSTARGLIFDQSAEMNDISRRDPTRFGVGYQPEVTWGDLDLFGKDIEIVIQYETPDGHKIQSQTKRVKVPARKAF